MLDCTSLHMDSPLQCPICEALMSDHRRECEIEARMTLAERSAIALPAHSAPEERNAEVILQARKRQVQICSRLDIHRASHHVA